MKKTSLWIMLLCSTLMYLCAMWVYVTTISFAAGENKITPAQAESILEKELGLGIKSFAMPGWVARDLRTGVVYQNLRSVVSFFYTDLSKNEKGEVVEINFEERVAFFVYEPGKLVDISKVSDAIFKSVAKPYIEKWQGKVQKSSLQKVEIEGKISYRRQMGIEYFASRYNKKAFLSFDFYFVEVETSVGKILLEVSRAEKDLNEYKIVEAFPLLVDVLNRISNSGE